MPQCSGESNPDSLFLLEILIKNVHYSYSSINLDKALICSLKETCVMVKFLHYPVMEIRQETTDKNENFNNPDIAIGSGKSCLFSLKGGGFLPQKLNVAFNVVRMCPEGSASKCITFGKAIVDLTKNFLALMRSSCSSSSPATKCVTDTFSLINDQCQKIGFINVFMRLSCFGSQITTQFKMGSDDKDSYVFKGEDARDRLEISSECFKLDCIDHDDGGGQGPCVPTNYGAPGMDGYNDGFQQPGFPPSLPYQGGPSPGGMGPPNMVTDCLNQQPPYPPSAMPRGRPPNMGGGYDRYQEGRPWSEQESGGGYSSCRGYAGGGAPSPQYLDNCDKMGPPQASRPPPPAPRPESFDAPKRNGKSKKDKPLPNFPQNYPFCQRVTIGGGDSESEDTTPPPEPPKLNLCSCDFPVPPGLIPPPPPPPKKPKKKKTCCPLEMTPGDYCMRADCPCGLPIVPWMAETPDDTQNQKPPNAGKFTMAPGSVGLKGKQIIFQMNDKDVPLTEADKKFMASTQYKVGAIGDKSGQKNVIQVIPDKLDDPSKDKDHDVFILKIGKKNDENKKAKMEIELKSPKFEDKTPKMMDNETQWLDSDVPPAAGKAGKDKGGKGAKGKKGKK